MDKSEVDVSLIAINLWQFIKKANDLKISICHQYTIQATATSNSACQNLLIYLNTMFTNLLCQIALNIKYHANKIIIMVFKIRNTNSKESGIEDSIASKVSWGCITTFI